MGGLPELNTTINSDRTFSNKHMNINKAYLPKPHAKNKRRLKGKSKSQKRSIRRNFNQVKSINTENVVINLSNKILSKAQTEVLNKGLGFVPNIDIIKINQINKDISVFERKLQLHYFFISKDLENFSGEPTAFIKPPPMTSNSNWWPKPLNPHITDFCHKVKVLINKTLHGKRLFNLSKTNVLALKELRKDKNIIIKRSDKGGGIAIMNVTDYKNKVLNMLNDPIVYTRVDEDDTVSVKTNTDTLINNLFLRRFIDSKQLKYLTNFSPNTPIFYGLPKVHKPNWPLRPIVSQINGPTCRLSEFLDLHLTVAESHIPFLLQDTTAFLNLIKSNEICEPNTILTTMDVASLYTNIPHEEGAEFVSNFYHETLHLWPTNYYLNPIDKEDIRSLILFLLKNCTFQFDNILYKQNFGTTMGSKFSVKFANIYMFQWFRIYLNLYHNNKPRFLARLIDDCFFLWPYSEEELTTLFNYLNNCHPTIKFETTHSKKFVHFLDTTVYIDNNTIKTKLYKKPTDKKKYLHFTSIHPFHVKKSIPFSQALRYKRIIVDPTILSKEILNLKSAFLKRNYPSKLLDSQINKINNFNRTSLLKYQSSEDRKNKFLTYLKGKSFLPLVITFNNNMEKPMFKNTFQLLWNNFVQSSDTISTIFSNELPQIVFKRGKTIGNYLISSKFNSSTNVDQENIDILASLLTENSDIPLNYGSFKCNVPRCLCCKSIVVSNYYKDAHKHSIFYLDNTYNCNSTDIIYFITCKKCDRSYIGQTSLKLKDRLNNHRSNTHLKKPTAISIHFNEPRHSFDDLLIIPILDISPFNLEQRNEIEKSYMCKLNTIYPQGLNNYPIIK